MFDTYYLEFQFTQRLESCEIQINRQTVAQIQTGILFPLGYVLRIPILILQQLQTSHFIQTLITATIVGICVVNTKP